MLDLWKKSNAFEKLRAKNKGGPRWSFLDGPITANGYMGVHHAWGRTYKDAFQRYFAMTGHDQRWQNGFDCQGLWVEVQVERDLGFKSKRDIEQYGIERFVERCKERVWKYSAIQTEQSVRLGMWMDWDNSYFTMSDENNYTIWSFLKKCHERGYVYKGLDAMPWCPRCGTGISEQERKEGYRSIEDEAVYVRLPLRGRNREYLLIWTTTPWTLAANVAAAVHPELAYSAVRKGDDVYYVVSTRVDVLHNPGRNKKSAGDNGAPAELVRELKGVEMLGWEYDGPFDHLEATAGAAAAHRVIEWDEVTDDSGTGIVHIAPGCGKEDFDLGRALDLPIISPINDSGIYGAGFGPLSDKAALEVSPLIFESLENSGLLYKRERYRHDYPHCWRCSTPLLFRAVDEWYIEMSWREEIKKNVDKIRWIPDYGRELELDWLKNMGDWMISKKRYWGLALPIYVCELCGWFDVVGGREELKERAVQGWDEFVGDPDHPHSPHRPWLDAVKIACGKCDGTASRIPDVGNPWLDAGIVPYSTVGYNSDRTYWAEWIPADFVVESFPGQFRNWFYALLAMSTMMEDIPPFKTLLGYALVRDENGDEMHYSQGNAIEFDKAADQMGADVMRWMYCRHNPTSNLNFGYAAGKQIERKVFGTLWNSYLFFANYARLDEFDPSQTPIPVKDRPEIDRWVLSDLQKLIESGRRQFEDYLIAPFIRQAEDFIENLSNWYIRRNRPRFWDPRGKDETGKLAAYQTLYEVLTTLVQLLAPVIPFLTERIYQNLAAPSSDTGNYTGVHLCSYPSVDPALVDETLSFQMGVVQQVSGAGRAIREQASKRVRQPLAEMKVAVATDEQRLALERLAPLLVEELNVKYVSVVPTLKDLTSMSASPNFASLGPKHGKRANEVAQAIRQMPESVASDLQSGRPATMSIQGEDFEVTPEDVHIHVETKPGWAVGETGAIQIALDITITPELEKEGLARDVVRHIQQLRKDIGLSIEDHIQCSFTTTDPVLREAILEWKDYIMSETQADSLEEGSIGLTAHEVEIGDSILEIELMLHTGG